MRLGTIITVFLMAFLSTASCFGEQVYWGIEYWQESVSGPNQVFVLKVDLQAKGVRPFVTPELNGGLLTTSKFVSNYGVQVGINTAFFDMGGSNKAIGYFASDGVPYSNHIPNDGYPTMGFDTQNHYLSGIESRGSMYNASSGSNLLVVNGAAVDNGSDSFSASRHPRTAVGVDQSGRYFFMVVVDGRYSNSVGMSLAALSEQMIKLGVYNGINMDGGGSSTMVIASKGLVNRPTGGTYQRSVASHLGFFANSGCEPSEEACNHYDDDCDGLVNEDGVCQAVEDLMYQAMIYDPQSTDVDGDGKADICARGAAGVYCVLSSGGDWSAMKLVLELSNDSGWNDVSNYATIRFADFNGDNKADLCARDDAGVKCWLSTGNGFGDATESIPMADADGYNDVKYYSTIRFADINGDGREDMCARFKDGFKCHLSKDNGWSEPIPLGDMSDEQGWGSPEYYTTIRTADINGDGKMDICARGSAGFRCWLSEGDKFAADFVATAWSNDNGWNKPQYYTTIRMADINGDNKADICARDASGIVCHISQGTSVGEALRGPDLADVHGWNDHDNYSTIHFGDINGDGKDDFCIRANANLACFVSNGDSFTEIAGIADMSDENGWNKPDQYRTIRLADINGDNKMDICGRSAKGVQCYIFNGTGYDSVVGPDFKNDSGWAGVEYYTTLRIGGPRPKACSHLTEVCDQIDNNCNGEIDENNVCCTPSEEICDGKDNDCDGEIDEDKVCCVPEICDEKDNDCDGEIDEDDVCKTEEECVPADEICDDIDNDCDGEIDEGLDCHSEDVCIPSEEICDNKDNDCNGKVDDGDVCLTGENDDDMDANVSLMQGCTCGIHQINQKTPGGLIGLFLLGSLGLYRLRRKKIRCQD